MCDWFWCLFRLSCSDGLILPSLGQLRSRFLSGRVYLEGSHQERKRSSTCRRGRVAENPLGAHCPTLGVQTNPQGPKSGFQMNLAQLSASGGFLHLKPLGTWRQPYLVVYIGVWRGTSCVLLFVPQFHKKRFCGGTLFFPHVVSPSIAIMRFFTAMNAVHWTAWLPRHAHNRLETVVEKEIKQSPQQRMSAEGMDPNSMEACGRGAGINDTYDNIGPQVCPVWVGVGCRSLP